MTGLPLWDVNPDVTVARHGGNPESDAAHASTPATERNRVRRLILAHVDKHGLQGRTSDEVVVDLGIPLQSAAARMSELKRDGDLVPSKRTRETRLGRAARVLVHKRWELHVDNEE